MEFILSHLWQTWLILGFVCLILELSSGDFFLFCVSIGAFASSLLSLTGVAFTWQVLLFVAVSVICIFFVRPVMLRHFRRKDGDKPSGADALVGRTGIVTERIEAGGFGRVKIDGDDWKAKCNGSGAVEKGQKVEVMSIDSIIITVQPK